MQPYKPSYKAPVVGIGLQLALTAVVGIATGALASFLSNWIYLIILFPLVMAAIVAWAVKIGVERGKIRNPILAAIVGLSMGFMTYASLHYFDYQALIREEVSYWTTELGVADGELERADVVDFIDEILVEETGSSGVWGFVKLQAQEGISIGDVGDSPDEMVGLGSIGTWIYFGLELAALTLIPAFAGFTVAREPFSEVCNSWYDARELIGAAPRDMENELKQALNNGNFEQVSEMLHANFPPPCIRVYLADVDACDLNEDQMVSVQRVSLDRKKRESSRFVLKGLLSHAEAERVRGKPVVADAEVW